ncbi:uncharacterized protein BDZ99DRAFT_448235 [Mytilinidion resinicola]|uniref:Aminoglycoside phosphotransferase domain-containing protein n=1 Tax=Mytilinidion resinicola TaxID=574789 RepID=A0A6A6YFD5_9PEZI|nr:uncharacterized protein BDZ99DRAFT_448235 [Mytilinidion resinicola]KAF2806734.1 hypothetical protein BDZ99DRAFT_448235 [Mytilinidion resinicola]
MNPIAAPAITPISLQRSEDRLGIDKIPEPADNDDAALDHDGAASDNDDAASDISETSTVRNEQEPFESYKTRVLALCRALWPAAGLDAFQIDRLRGGSFNRIISITIHPHHAKKHSAAYFLTRLRRFFAFCLGSVEQEQLRQYILRIPRVDDPDITYEIAMFRYVAHHTSLPVPGITHFDLTQDNALSHSYSIQERILGSDLNAMGFFSDTTFSLCHLDFFARNVIVEVRDESTVTIQGILDWDSAVFGPEFLVCAAPHWIWTPDEDCEEDDETQALTDPKTLEGQELKRTFDEAVGPEFLRYVYEPPYRMARAMFNLLREGAHCDWDRDQYTKLAKDWEEFKSSRRSASGENPFDTPSIDSSTSAV